MNNNDQTTPTVPNIATVNTQSTTQQAVQPKPVIQSQQLPADKKKVKKKSHGKGLFIFLLILIIAAMGYYIYTDYQKDLKNKCSPLVTDKNKQNVLDLNSTIVQDLYQKVKTNIKEDIASTDLDDNMRLYLAYRQIPTHEIYESNCNLFNNTNMTSVTCDDSNNIVPMAFKEETLQRELKKLFGEDVEIPNNNIQLGSTCLGGYQYIPDRGEYVSGQCNNSTTTIYKADKKLIEAYAYNDTVVLKEKVRYYGSENVDIDRLKDGVYVYTFKLDNNYNYVYVSKTIEKK